MDKKKEKQTVTIAQKKIGEYVEMKACSVCVCVHKQTHMSFFIHTCMDFRGWTSLF